MTVQGGRRPTSPPRIFDEVTKSCLKQVTSTPRTTKSTTWEVRRKKQAANEKKKDIL